MTFLPERKPSSEPQTGDVPKVRQCLRCKSRFASEWSGERVCPRCKSSNAWRSGTPHRSPTSNNRR